MKRIILLAVALMVASSNDKICETKLDMIQGCVIKEYQGKVLVKETPYKNNKINGIVKEYYPSNGKLKFMDTVKDDAPNGKREAFYSDGQLEYSVFCKNGKVADGTNKMFYDNGKVKLETSTFNGVLHGETKIYKRNGELALTVDFKNDNVVNKSLIISGEIMPIYQSIPVVEKLCK